MPDEPTPDRPGPASRGAPKASEEPGPAEVNLSDYLDPPGLEWGESDCKAAEAVCDFSEGIHADD